MGGEFFLIVFVSQLVLWIFATKIGLGKSVSVIFGSILIIAAFYRLLYVGPDVGLVCSDNFELIKNGILTCSLSSREFLLVALIPWIGLLYNAYVPKIKHFITV